MLLINKRVLITGADGGIGSVIAERFHQQGSELILLGLSKENLDALNRKLDGQHTVVVADLTDEQARENLVEDMAQAGGLDILINNAGISDFSLVEDQDPARLESLLKINLYVPMMLCQQFLPQLKGKPQAAIVNMGSTFGSIGYPGFSAYSASKFAIRGYTETLRRELLDSSVQVVYLAPRAVKTPINTPAVVALNEELGNAMDEPHVVADALVGMIIHNKTTEYLGWPEKLFVRVNSLLPRIVDNALRGKLDVIRKFARH